MESATKKKEKKWEIQQLNFEWEVLERKSSRGAPDAIHLARPAAVCLSLYPFILTVHTNIVSPLFSSFRTPIFPYILKNMESVAKKKKKKVGNATNELCMFGMGGFGKKKAEGVHRLLFISGSLLLAELIHYMMEFDTTGL